MNPARTALVGATGFVGSNLRRDSRFEAEFNSQNIEAIQGQAFDRVICCGVPAAKWVANQEPDDDRASIRKLVDPLRGVECREFILVSTIDVYARPVDVDEDDPGTAPDDEPYGRHRRDLEHELRSFLPLVRAIRLPALFGHGLKKNALFDLIHRNRTEFINPAAVFQWYDLQDLPSDIEQASRLDLQTLNLTSEPLPMENVIERFFPEVVVGAPDPANASHYNVRSKWAHLWGSHDGYMYSATAMMDKMETFMTSERAQGE